MIKAAIRKKENDSIYQLGEQKLAEAERMRIDGQLEVTTAKLSDLRASNIKLEKEKSEAMLAVSTIKMSITTNNGLVSAFSVEEKDLAKQKEAAQHGVTNASEECIKIEKEIGSLKTKLELGVNYAFGPLSLIRKAQGISCYDDANAMNGVVLQNIVKDLKEHDYQENEDFQRIAAMKQLPLQLPTGNGSRKKEWWLQYVCDILDVPCELMA